MYVYLTVYIVLLTLPQGVTPIAVNIYLSIYHSTVERSTQRNHTTKFPHATHSLGSSVSTVTTPRLVRQPTQWTDIFLHFKVVYIYQQNAPFE